MEPKYSILLCNQLFAEYKNRITEWLHSGIKVFWFGSRSEAEELKSLHADFAKEFLLQAYVVDFRQEGVIVDGNDKSDMLVYAGHLIHTARSNCTSISVVLYHPNG